MQTLVSFGEASLDVSDRKIDYEECTEERFAVAHAFLVDTYETCTYHRQRMDRAGVDPGHIRSFDDFAKLPKMGPEDVVATSQFSLLPDRYLEALKKGGLEGFAPDELLWRRFTSTGSTGVPKASYYTSADWDVGLESTFRNYRHVPTSDWSRTMNFFHAGHIAGKFTEDYVVRQGLFLENRHFLVVTDDAALRQLYHGAKELGGFNAIAVPPCLPPQLKMKKGVTLDDLLNVDEQNYIGSNVRSILTGGFPTDHPDFRLRERVWEANELAGAPKTHFLEIYGCAELFTNVGTNCEADDGLHLNRGHMHVEVLDEKTGEPVGDGERGLVTLTGFKHGSRFVRYLIGDEATFVSKPCECGRVTPRIKTIRRVLDKERIKSGCAAGGIG